MQGYLISEDEINISLSTFKEKYNNGLGYPEYATPILFTTQQSFYLSFFVLFCFFGSNVIQDIKYYKVRIES